MSINYMYCKKHDTIRSNKAIISVKQTVIHEKKAHSFMKKTPKSVFWKYALKWSKFINFALTNRAT